MVPLWILFTLLPLSSFVLLPVSSLDSFYELSSDSSVFLLLTFSAFPVLFQRPSSFDFFPRVVGPVFFSR